MKFDDLDEKKLGKEMSKMKVDEKREASKSKTILYTLKMFKNTRHRHKDPRIQRMQRRIYSKTSPRKK